ncbi:MAG: response regulator [Endomicrobiaceae bacterium]|jgi:DNA-binding NtrC family response regulator|nr:response regulator [Endomicrobiaceae bacterium]
MENGNVTKVLIIEDEPSERLSLKASLEAVGMQVEAVETGLEAESLVKDMFFDVLIVDYRLPDIDGLNLIKKLNLISSDLIPIVVTAYSSVEIAVEAMRMGAYDYMVKPLNIDSLLKTIETMLKDREALINGRKKLTQMVGSNMNYIYKDEDITVISAFDSNVLLDKTEISLIDKLKIIFNKIKNYYWGS